LRGYGSEKRFYIDLLKKDGACDASLMKDEVCEAALYLEEGGRMIEFAVARNHRDAIEKLQGVVSTKIRESRAIVEDGSC